jgi:putative phosphonate metabolism protein
MNFTGDYARFALYYTPPAGPLADFGAAWLGWDIARGDFAEQPVLRLPRAMADITAEPRKYGFHATLKPPFQLADGHSAGALHDAARALCAVRAPVTLPALRLARLGRFLALIPDPQPAVLNSLAAALVADLDTYRAPPSDADLARRRAAPLTPAQDALLVRWGYPYVMDEFRFHMTLTGKLDTADIAAVEQAARDRLGPLATEGLTITDITLAGSDETGYFHQIARLPLSG